jgi:hypothetical protein
MHAGAVVPRLSSARVSRPRHRCDRRSPVRDGEPRGDLRSPAWQGQETLPQQRCSRADITFQTCYKVGPTRGLPRTARWIDGPTPRDDLKTDRSPRSLLFMIRREGAGGDRRGASKNVERQSTAEGLRSKTASQVPTGIFNDLAAMTSPARRKPAYQPASDQPSCSHSRSAARFR